MKTKYFFVLMVAVLMGTQVMNAQNETNKRTDKRMRPRMTMEQLADKQAAKIVTDLGLQSEYRKKRGLRWIGQYPNSDLVIAYPPAFLDTIASTTKIHVKVRKKDYVVKVQHGRFRHSKHVVQDLTTPFETCAGAICFNILTPTKKLPRGNQYNITIYPRPVAIDLYQKRITIAEIKKDSRVIEMSSTSDIPARSVDFMQKLIDRPMA